MPPTNDPREAERRRAARVKRGQAWRKAKRREEWRQRLAEKEKEAQQAQAEAEQMQKEADARRAARVKRGQAWRKDKRREQWRSRIKERENQAQEARKQQEANEKQKEKQREEGAKKSAAGAAAGRVAGGALGRRAGAALGTAVAGPVGAVVGGVIGGAIGSRIGGKVGGKAAGGGGGEGSSKGDADGSGAGDGPLSGAMSGASELAEQTQKALKLVGSAARFAGEGLEKVARGDALGAFAQGADKAAEALDEIPVVGKVAGESLRTFTTVVTTANRVVGAFAERGRQLQGYSGAIAGAAARQDVTRVLSDIREAQQLGDKYARLLDKQTAFEETLKASLMPLKEWALDVLPKVLDTMLDVLIGILRGIDKMVPGTTLLTRIADSAEAMRKKMAEGGPAAGDIFSAWLAAPGGIGHLFPALLPAPPGPLGLPIVGPLVPPGP